MDWTVVVLVVARSVKERGREIQFALRPDAGARSDPRILGTRIRVSIIYRDSDKKLREIRLASIRSHVI